MTEFIVRLTDEQEATIRRYLRREATAEDVANRYDIKEAMWDQVRAALALYDELVAEAKAKSDD